MQSRKNPTITETEPKRIWHILLPGAILAGRVHARFDVNFIAASGGHLFSDLSGSVQRADGVGHGTDYVTPPRSNSTN